MATCTQQLAQPKPNRLQYPDRRSVYWLNELPHEEPGSTATPELTHRLLELSRSKQPHVQLTRSPIWEVTEWALRAVPSERLCRLAQPRVPAAGWQPDLPLLAPLKRAAQTTVASSRICQLAQPRTRQVPEVSSHEANHVPLVDLSYKASAHIESLATPKHDHPKFKGERSVHWTISKAVRNYVASQRIAQLSCPKERKALFEGYDPYTVSRAARSATPSPRIQQLCLPLPRKCSSE